MYGFNGDDFIDGRGGNDLICTSGDHNTAIGGPGDDRIEGGPDGEILVGDEYSTTGPAEGSGNDEIAGGAGQDINIGDGYSTVAAASGSGNDRLGDGDGADVIVGDAYSPISAIGTGTDKLTGGEGNDVEVGDALVGTPQDPVSSPEATAMGNGNDEINGFPGNRPRRRRRRGFWPRNRQLRRLGQAQWRGQR
ncbi:MAG: calcium-binding protein [Solirubrobacterales bacterium]